ncbi:MAG: hypothetical protein L0M04_06345 [Enterococcus sp.]|uniref:xylulokinase n=1 Tax=Enterococcus sp. TaxID=35783 RepID=UPI002648371B|nr:FGGY family carbohydrate kinase [Enterococcus sp.]MDN6215680.1 hypothetical protein [Enterococcus sp.]MDN6560023.1 hypothetical protein [Enterococcus sp.]MDN6584622.1 hypothetical protein [Enterococcus sp.]MDN6649515.1 hypothetical protein [Enterococcus sp.]MDN6691256.1 hypothetical protein [Enterococcus sp.]
MKDATVEYFIGIDIGTTSIKSVVYDDAFQIIDQKNKKYAYIINENGWTEIDPSTWSKIVLEQLREIFSIISYQKVKGIGITGQMHTTVFLDSDNQPVRPAIMWNDKRTGDVVERIKAQLPENEQTKNILKIVSTGSPLANLIWVKEHEPDYYERLDKLLIAKDYIRLVLTGEWATDFCDASTSSLFNVHKKEWSRELLEMFHLPSTLLPKVQYASSSAGNLNLALVGIKGESQIPVIIGTGDNVASAIANQSKHEDPIISLGTSGVVILTNSKDEWLAKGKNILAEISKDDQRIVTQGALQSGAKVIEWWSNQIILQNVTQFECELEKKLGNNKVIFFPYLSGDKTLFNESNLSGAFYGIDLTSTQNDFSLAVYEGVAFAIKRLIQEMHSDRSFKQVLLIGGGAKSQLWPKIFANVLDMTIQVNQESREASCGAAMLAYYHQHHQFPELVTPLKKIAPEKELTVKYQKKYQSFIEFSNAIIQKERRQKNET